MYRIGSIGVGLIELLFNNAMVFVLLILVLDKLR